MALTSSRRSGAAAVRTFWARPRRWAVAVGAIDERPTTTTRRGGGAKLFGTAGTLDDRTRPWRRDAARILEVLLGKTGGKGFRIEDGGRKGKEMERQRGTLFAVSR